MPIPTPEQLAAFESTPSRVANALEGLNPTILLQHIKEDSWSIHEIIIHLGDSEVVGFERLRRIIAEDQSTFVNYDEEGWARRLDYQKQDPTIALELFAALRRSSSALLRMVDSRAWDKTGQHPTRGPMTLYDTFLLYLEHGTIHLDQIEQIKASL